MPQPNGPVPTTAVAASDSPAKVPLPRDLRFLVVDDDRDIRDLLERMIKRLGFTSRAASNGVEAIELLATESFDFMLLNLTMPRMSGEDAARWLKNHPDRSKGLRVVVVSAGAGPHRANLQELGVHAVLSKPLRIDQIRDLISETQTASLTTTEAPSQSD